MYKINKEITPKAKVYKNIYAQDFLFVVAFVGFMYMLGQNSVKSGLVFVLYNIFNLILAIYLISASPTNPTRSRGQTMLSYIINAIFVFQEENAEVFLAEQYQNPEGISYGKNDKN